MVTLDFVARKETRKETTGLSAPGSAEISQNLNRKRDFTDERRDSTVFGRQGPEDRLLSL